MEQTVDIFPDEGEIQTSIKIRRRIKCSKCGAPAHYKHTFLLKNARNNPASKAYKYNDPYRCEDAHTYVCQEHLHERTPPDGYEWNVTFPASERFKSLFLYWEEYLSPNLLPICLPSSF